MSSGPTPTPSPFVRGTSNSQVYFLENNQRRLVPDADTLNFISAGQAVRTLSDADLAAIPLGVPLPSRKDGTLLEARQEIVSPAKQAYFMTGGFRRLVPDPNTLQIMTNAGLKPVDIDSADLNAIPLGPVLPTRRDGTLYRGSATIYAYLIQGAKKQAIPDATTLRDSGHDPQSLIAISAQDLALIPDGPALPSTSKFLNPPDASIPLVLLPVRLETRFQTNQLWLRIFPDDVHVNSFEPELTAEETAARANLLTQAQKGSDQAMSAFTALGAQFGAERAAWIASASADHGAKAAQWTKAPFTNTLPERWIVLGYQGNAPGQILAIGPAISDSLAVGPAPDGPGPSQDEGMAWITDFNQAVQAGMGFRITLTAEQQRGFNRIVVVGLNSGLERAQAAERFGDLFEAHHYTDGLELLQHNTPTNNTDTVKSGLSTRDPNYQALYGLEQGPPLCPSRPTSDGDRLARALSIDPTLLAHVQGADGGLDEQASAMNEVLWPATWGYYLEQIVTGAVPTPETLLPIARDHFDQHVRARGHFPILRIGREPYGLLPVCWSANWKPLEGRALDQPLASLLARMRTTWENSVANLTRIPGAQDPEAALVTVLGQTASSQSYALRSLVGPEYNLAYWGFVQKELAKTWWSSLAAKTLADTGDLSTLMANTRLANAAYSKLRRPLSDLVVAPEPLSGQPAPAYVAQLAALGWQALRDYAMPSPAPLLLLLLRHAALRQYLDTATNLLVAAGVAQPSEKLEAELVDLPAGARPSAWDLLARTLPGKGPVGTYLDGAKQDVSNPDFANFWQAFQQLAKYSAEDLDFLTREVLDLGSYRFDAWVSSLAQFRLDEIRRVTPNDGIVLGGYGWVEDVRPAGTQPASAGYVHAPSLAHSTTAAVLRSGYLSHKNGAQQPFQINLSSDRVRLGLHLLDGIRQGQPLGALLGYRLERTLHESGKDSYIGTLRQLAPLGGTGTSEETTTDAVAANDVVDGLALLRQYNNPQFWSSTGLPPPGQDRDAVAKAIARLEDALDAVADLTLAESVHQLLRGNTIRAGATLDAIARGDTVPPDLDVIETPRTGTGVTHRLMAVAIGSDAPGWTSTPRAQAEPRLNSFMATLLGDPSKVRVSTNFVDASAKILATVEVSLDKLQLAPVDFLAFPENDGMTGELADRFLYAASKARPTVAANAGIQLLAGRSSSWTPDILSLNEWTTLLKAVSRLVSGARPLQSGDLMLPGQSSDLIAADELKKRADSAASTIQSVRNSLAGTSGIDAALLSAANLGVSSAVPSIDSAQWIAQAQAAGIELDKRIATLNSVAPGQDESRLQAIFGDAFIVLPVLASSLSSSWPEFWANSLTLQGGDATASATWFQRASRVRPGAARLDLALLMAETLSGKSLVNFDVAQLPAGAADRWLGLDLQGKTPSSGLSLVSFSPTSYTAGAAVAGLLIDEWVELIPSTNEISGITFHHDDPTSRAPQAILLAVRPDDFPEWTIESLEGSVLEALDLAKLRAVDPDTLSALGHYLPALYFADNSGGNKPEAVSADFNALLKTAVMRND